MIRERHIMLAVIATGAVYSGPLKADDWPAPRVEQADRVLVDKSERKLFLLKGEQTLREFDVSLGLVPTGHKTQSGDSRTPEGRYYLDSRNTDSDFFLSIFLASLLSGSSVQPNHTSSTLSFFFLSAD